MRQPAFCTLIHTSRILGLPRDWLINQISSGMIPHLVIGGQVYLHVDTVIDYVIQMMRRNVTSEYSVTSEYTLPMLVDGGEGEDVASDAQPQLRLTYEMPTVKPRNPLPGLKAQ
jgi:hypothetical protein